MSSGGRFGTVGVDRVDELLDRAGERLGAERRNLLREANRVVHERAPWLFLVRQYDVYGVNAALDWRPRPDGRIGAYEIR